MSSYSLPQDTYPHRMSNFEFTRFEILNVKFLENQFMVDYVDAVMTITFLNNPHQITITRPEILSGISKGDGFYFKGKRLLLEKIGNLFFIHSESSGLSHDLLD